MANCEVCVKQYSRGRILALYGRAVQTALYGSGFKPKPGLKPDADGTYWITVNGNKIPIKEGEDLREKLLTWTKPTPLKEMKAEKFLGPNADKIRDAIGQGRSDKFIFNWFVDGSMHFEDEFGEYPTPALMLQKIKEFRKENKDLASKAKSFKSSKVPSMKFHTGTRDYEPMINKIVDRLPKSHIKLADTINIKQTAFGGGASGTYYPRKNVVNVTIRQEHSFDAENVFAHEIAHSVWHKHRTQEQRLKWIERLKEEKVGDVTAYAGSYGPRYRGLPDGDRVKPGQYWNETHSEVYAYIHAQDAMVKASEAMPKVRKYNKPEMEKAVKIYKELFGDD